MGSLHGKPFQFHVRMNELPARVREHEPPPYEPMPTKVNGVHQGLVNSLLVIMWMGVWLMQAGRLHQAAFQF